ncbi:hypothetical protein J2T12_004842 [Paenibacillus anaericanus]|nr:hypothetical protein [Paenibacillus anaericanus]
MKRQLAIILSIIIGIIMISVISLMVLFNSKWSSEIKEFKSNIPITQNSK